MSKNDFRMMTSLEKAGDPHFEAPAFFLLTYIVLKHIARYGR